MSDSIQIKKIDTNDKRAVFHFINFPHYLYSRSPYWVPPFNIDVYLKLDKNRYPFYEHSDADFFIAVKNGKIVGRIAAIENKRYNNYHNSKTANFYFFDCEKDTLIVEKLFDAVFDWAKKKGLNTILGPKGLGAFDGYGILVSGFEQMQTMNMLNYNYDYYSGFLENLGFEKEVDFVSYYLPKDKYKIPDRIETIAQKVKEKNGLKTYNFKSKKDMIRFSERIGKLYNSSFVNNWEYSPLTESEIKFIAKNIISFADHRLIKLIMYKDEIVGFIFAFPDISVGMQKAKGRINPLTILDIIFELRRTEKLTVNGIGILPEFQGHGGNALLYYELGRTILQFKRFKHIEMPQIAETAKQMSLDVLSLNGKEYKRHRIYRKNI